jgi:hypothetical protein
MRTRTKVWFGAVTALAALMVIRLPAVHDLDGTQRIEFTSVVKNPKAARSEDRVVQRTVVILDPNEIKEVCEMIPRIWHHPLDQNSLESWQEMYTLRFVRTAGTTQIPFTETEWSPAGRTPHGILEWARKKANQQPPKPTSGLRSTTAHR